jgi:hypothetical protein
MPEEDPGENKVIRMGDGNGQQRSRKESEVCGKEYRSRYAGMQCII